MTFGARLRQARKNIKMTQDELAAKLNSARPTISSWENDVYLPGVENVTALAKALDVTVAYLMGEGNNNYASEPAIYTSDLIKLTMYAIPTVVSCEMELTPLKSSKGVGIVFTKVDSFAVYDEKTPPFAVVMPNNSMRGAGIDEGEFAVVNPAEPAENGKPAFVIYNGSGLIRWIIQKADGSVELQTANSDYTSIIVEKDYVNNTSMYHVVGLVVEVLSSQKPKDAF